MVKENKKTEIRQFYDWPLTSSFIAIVYTSHSRTLDLLMLRNMELWLFWYSRLLHRPKTKKHKRFIIIIIIMLQFRHTYVRN